MTQAGDEAIVFAERILGLLHRGRRSSTYKFAVLLALIDLCLERSRSLGEPPDTLLTSELAEKVIELYWPQTARFAVGETSKLLRQGGGRRGFGADIIEAIARFRTLASPEPSMTISRARLLRPVEWQGLLRFVEWKLIEMPLPRLQRAQEADERLLYEIDWDETVRRSDVSRAQRDGSGPFDNRVHLRPGVGLHLVRLSRLLRPLVHRMWAAMVAELNDLEDARLEAFLFGTSRVSLEPVRAPLQDLQDDRCFYCGARFGRRGGSAPHVDHFVPWSRYPDNGLDNLVVAHERCNCDKSDHLATVEHVGRWRARFDEEAPVSTALGRLAAELRWDRDARRTLSAARATYLHLAEGTLLWRFGSRFEPLDRLAMEAALVGGMNG